VSKNKGHNIGAVVEWSPNGAQSFEPMSKRRSAGATISSLGLSPNGHTTVLAVSRRTAFVKPTHVPNTGEAEIRQVLQMRLGQLFPVAPGELAYDLWLTGSVTSEGRLAVVCGVQSETLRALNLQASQAGIKSSLVVPAGLGSVLLARSLGMRDCTVVEKCAEGFAIDIVVSGELRWSRVVPGNVSKSELENEIDRTHAMSEIPRGALVAAGDLTLDSAAVGTAASTLEMLASPQTQGLGVRLELPETVANRRAGRDSTRLRRAAMLAVLACLVWGKVGYDAAGSSAALAKVEAGRQKSVRQERALLSQAQSERAKASKVNEILTRALKPAQSFGDIMAVVANDAPGGLWLAGVNMERGKPIILRGTAMTSETVAVYLQKLASEPRFRDVKLIFANNGLIDTTPVVQFSVSAHAIGNLPVVEMDKDKKKP
jgi:hypothetical protein